MLDSILGHLAQRQVLQRIITSQRQPSGLLFLGHRGLGKTTLAQQYIRASLCKTGLGSTCDCQSCQQFSRNMHPDTLAIESQDGTIRIDSVRQVLPHLQHRSHGGRRFILIADANQCSPEAASALLKAVEEGSAATTFVLTATWDNILPRTIHSRCHTLALHPVSDSDVAQFLQDRYPDGDHALTTALAEGRFGQADEYHLGRMMTVRSRALDILTDLTQKHPRHLMDHVDNLEDTPDLAGTLTRLRDVSLSLCQDMLRLQYPLATIRHRDLGTRLQELVRMHPTQLRGLTQAWQSLPLVKQHTQTPLQHLQVMLIQAKALFPVS
jgi:replication-associated recombination protein RarA